MNITDGIFIEEHYIVFNVNKDVYWVVTSFFALHLIVTHLSQFYVPESH
jgi:hypothetical protein